ncbi:unnamed protein product [Phytophthora fragariaefolia]|uniref:Unnamed protein product n=1 Tax=Phytophthora fragariaefolia TaxID=1490495 RepID=A0A9W6Y394_9STRA|nr:unnamed protein product [Phytophthora fragariaefolia]
MAGEVYLLGHPLVMLRHHRLTNNVKCSASVGEQHVVVADDEERQNFMQSLGPAWNGFVGALEGCTAFKLMIQRCQAEAIRRDQQKNRKSSGSSGGNTAAAFSAEHAHSKKVGKFTKKRDMSKAKCYNCNKLGHFARECKSERVQPKPEAASMAFNVVEDLCDNKREWIVDSGATSHMTGHLDNLTNVCTLEEPRVLTVASGVNLVATAIGKAPLLKNSREICVLHEVLFVKGLARNLVSVAAASRRGMTVAFTGSSCTIRSPNGVTLLASRLDQPMYVVEAVSETGMANIVVEPFHLEMAYPLRDKSSQAQLDAVKDCIARMKAYTPSYRVAFLKSDNAAEYAGRVLAAYCKKKEIVQEFSTPIHQEPLPDKGARWKDADGGSPRVATRHQQFARLWLQSASLGDERAPQEVGYEDSQRSFIGYATGGAYLVHIPHNGAGETIPARTVVFYEDQFLPTVDEEDVRISTVLDGVQEEPFISSERRLLLETNENDDVAMSPADFEQQLTQCSSSIEHTEPVGAARPNPRARGDPRREKSIPPPRRSSRIPKPSQRRLDFEASHLTMHEVCNMIEERTAAVRFDGTNAQDDYIYRELTPSEIDVWALGFEPLNVFEVRRNEFRREWEDAMDTGIQRLLDNDTLVEVPLPPGHSAVKSKWVFKMKTNQDGSLDKFKARVVSKGFSQRFGDDYTETFSQWCATAPFVWCLLSLWADA